MKIDGYFNAVFFAFILVFSLGIASLGAKGPTSLIGFTPTPTLIRYPTYAPLPTATLPPGVPTATLPPGVPTATLPPGVPTNTPVPPTATTAPVPPTATPVSSPPCPNLFSSETYGTVGMTDIQTSPADTARPDLALSLRTLNIVNQPLTLQNYAGATDPNAPQFSTVLSTTPALPTFSTAYKIDPTQEFDTWPVNALGFATTPSTSAVFSPRSGYLAYGVILYARTPDITIGYSTNDNIVRNGVLLNGYRISITGVCVDPNLSAAYNNLNASGRGNLPTASNGQRIGTAKGSEIIVTIRDSGSLLDPRSRKDWWIGF